MRAAAVRRSVLLGTGLVAALAAPAHASTDRYVAAVLADAPGAFWLLDEPAGTVAADASGAAADATYIGATLGGSGAIGTAADRAPSFTDGGARVESTRDLAFTGRQAFTLEAWVRPGSVDANQRYVMAKEGRNALGQYEGYRLALNASLGLYCQRWQAGANARATAPATVLPADAWSHVACSYDGTSLRLYVNGAAVGGPVASSHSIAPHATRFAIGALPGTTTTQFSGSIDEVAVYATALTPGRLAVHAAAARSTYVDRTSAGCSDTRTRGEASAPDVPLCTLQRAAAVARPGDTVHVAPGTYTGTFAPAVSGVPGAPITFVGDAPGVILDAAGAPDAVRLVGVGQLRFAGLTIRGAASHGMWLDTTTGIELDGVTAAGNAGSGIALKASSGATIHDGTVSGNRSTGIVEFATSSHNSYLRNTITANGADGIPTGSGSGVVLSGAGGLLSGNVIRANGDPGSLYEHGLYVGRTASSFVIEHNVIDGNAAADIKASGAGGLVRYNRLGSAGKGIVLSDNASATTVYENLIVGTFQHAVFLTTDTTAARAVLWNNQIVQTGRCAGCSGSASAVFVNASAQAVLRNNLICSTDAVTGAAAIEVTDPARALGLAVDHDWVCSQSAGGRHLIWGTSRLDLPAWQAQTGQGAASIASAPPSFDADFHVVGANLGLAAGLPLGIPADYEGHPITTQTPDLGAFQR